MLNVLVLSGLCDKWCMVVLSSWGDRVGVWMVVPELRVAIHGGERPLLIVGLGLN